MNDCDARRHAMLIQICRKIHWLGCVTRALVLASFTQPIPRILLHICTVETVTGYTFVQKEIYPKCDPALLTPLYLTLTSNAQTGHEIRRDGYPRSHPCPHPDCRSLFSTAKNLELHLASGAHENTCHVCDRQDRCVLLNIVSSLSRVAMEHFVKAVFIRHWDHLLVYYS